MNRRQFNALRDWIDSRVMHTAEMRDHPNDASRIRALWERLLREEAEAAAELIDQPDNAPDQHVQ